MLCCLLRAKCNNGVPTLTYLHVFLSLCLHYYDTQQHVPVVFPAPVAGSSSNTSGNSGFRNPDKLPSLACCGMARSAEWLKHEVSASYYI
jgi:hypothetical protein